jgi:hypothetical protein
VDDDPRFRIEDQELDSLSLQEQLADRLLKQIVVNLPGYCQVETPIRLTLFQDVVVKDELSQGFLEIVNV